MDLFTYNFHDCPLEGFSLDFGERIIVIYFFDYDNETRKHIRWKLNFYEVKNVKTNQFDIEDFFTAEIGSFVVKPILSGFNGDFRFWCNGIHLDLSFDFKTHEFIELIDDDSSIAKSRERNE